METLKSKGTPIYIDLNFFLNSFRTKLQNHLSADMICLRLIMSAINDKSIIKFQDSQAKGMIFRSILPPITKELIDYEIINTFISMMRNINNYFDVLIALINLIKKPIEPQSRIIDPKEYIQSHLKGEIMDYCSRSREEMVDKLKHFGELSSDFIKYLKTYSLIRNRYEHHKAISKKELQIPIAKAGLYTKDGKEMEFGKIVEVNSPISFRFEEKVININKGEKVILSYEDLVSVQVFLMFKVPMQIEPAVDKIFKETLPDS